MFAHRLGRLYQLAALALLLALPAQAQQPPASALGTAQLEQLVASIALHPDALLSQILMASTYPTEVVQAERWAAENKSLDDEQLQKLVEQQGWDSSVKSLIATPSVLTMMSKKLDWTQSLGDAVLAQQADVMAAIQRLRAKARTSEKLRTPEQQKVTVSQEGNKQTIAIERADAGTIYVPYYDPGSVYGEWPYPDYPPYYWENGSIIGTGIAFGGGYALWRWLSGGHYWGGDINWSHGQIDINRGHRVEHWRHDPRHRGNVPYRDAHVAQRFGEANRADAREALRGKTETGRRDLATTAGAVAAAGAGAAAKTKARAAAKSRPSGSTAKHAGKAKASAKTKSAAHTNRPKSAKNAKSKHTSRTGQAGRSRAATHRAHARTRSPTRHAQRRAFSPNMGARGGGFRATGFRSGGFRGGGGRGGGRGGRRSDIALKHDVVLLRRLDNGLGIYRFAYNGSNKAYVGVLAQEVQKVVPEAVVRGRDGYLNVKYELLGLKFQTYRQWSASGSYIPRRKRVPAGI